METKLCAMCYVDVDAYDIDYNTMDYLQISRREAQLRKQNTVVHLVRLDTHDWESDLDGT